MAFFLVLGGASALLLAIFMNVASRKVVQIRDRFLESACATIREVYVEISEEYDRGTYTLDAARQLFHDRSEGIIINYCEQLYGSKNNTPMEKYRRLREQVEVLDRNFLVAFQNAG